MSFELLTIFGATLFFVLAATLQWRQWQRRAASRTRIDRGLRDYINCAVTAVPLGLDSVPATER
jgi:hypothetical protein